MKPIFLALLLVFSTSALAAAAYEQMLPGIYRGPHPSTEKEFRTLLADGIRTIVDLQGDPYLAFVGRGGESEADRAHEYYLGHQVFGFKVIQVPVNAVFGIDDQIEARLVAAAKLIHQRKYQPVYVHCALSEDRTGLFLAVYRIVNQNCSHDKAERELWAHGWLLTPLITSKYHDFLIRLEAETRASAAKGETCPLR